MIAPSNLSKSRWNLAIVLLSNVVFLLHALPMAVIGLRGHGQQYYLRSTDLFLARDQTRAVLAEDPGIENVLLPAVGAVAKYVLNLAGLDYGPAQFYALSILSYLAFTVAVTWAFSRAASPWFTIAVAGSLFGSGLVPYMFTWGGYVDGLSYLLTFFGLLWMPRSVVSGLLVLGLATLNHYLGTLAIAVAAGALFVERAERRYLVFIGGAAAMLLASQLGWSLAFPDAASLRTEILFERLQAGNRWDLVKEVYGPTPWNLLSPLKLTSIPVLFAIAHPRWLPWRTRAAIALPLVAGAVLILAFVDVTRTATHFFIISLLLTLSVMQREAGSAGPGATCRKTFQILAVASALLPAFYVNNGAVVVVRSTALGVVFSRMFE